MTRSRAGIAAAFALTLGGLATPSHADTALILSQTAAQLTAIDSQTGTVHRSLPLPAGPANIAISSDGTRAYIAHSDLGQISVVDLAQWRVAAVWPATGSPFGLAASASGKLYAGDWNGDSIQELDAATGSLQRSVVAGRAPAHLALTPDGKLLVAAAREANSVAIIDTATFTAKQTLPVERAPFALAVTHDGTRAMIANAQAGSVSEIDLATLRVTGSTRVGAMPYGVAFTHDDALALVTNQQSGTVRILPQPRAASLSSTSVGGYPEGIAVTPDGTKAYVANWFSDDVSIIDIAAGKQLSRFKVPAGPRTVAIVTGSFGR